MYKKGDTVTRVPRYHDNVLRENLFNGLGFIANREGSP